MQPPEKGGSRIAIIMNGSPLFTGDAGGGETEIRRWILEHDWLEAIVALPTELFYNTGIATYIWVLTNRKAPSRKGKVLLVNGAATTKANGTEENVFARRMRRSLGEKRKELAPEHIDALARLAAEFDDGPYTKVFDTAGFGYRRITVERPLRLSFQASRERIARLHDEPAFQSLAKSRKKGAMAEVEVAAGAQQQAAILAALATLDGSVVHTKRAAFELVLDAALRARHLKLGAPLRKAILSALSEPDDSADICRDAKGRPEPDTALRDSEYVPLAEDVRAYFEREVRPHVPDAWIDERARDHKDGGIGKVGYEINFNRYFYQYEPPRPLEAIDADLAALEQEILDMLREVVA
jgi:type I restriction enzyme M protein